MRDLVRVLVDGAGGDVGQGVLKSLIDSKLNIDLYATCINESSSWLYKVKKSFIFPEVNENGFIDYLIYFLKKHKIDVYFPTIDSSLLKISENKQKIESITKTKVFIGDKEKIKICDDKFLTNLFLEKNGFLTPKTISLDDDKIGDFLKSNKFPLILKSKKGNGSKEVFKVSGLDEIKSFLGSEHWILQENLNIENEITSGVYIGNDNEIKCVYVLKRTLKHGSTYKAERILDDELENKIVSIAKKLGMTYLNIQAVYENGNLIPFEFNGRMSGTTGAVRQVFNFPEAYIREVVFGEYVKPATNKSKIYIARYNEEVVYLQQEMDLLIKRSELL